MELTQQENRKEKFSSLKTWAKLIPFLKPYSRNMAGILILMLVNAGIDISFPLLSGYAVDQFVTPRTSEGLTGFAALYMVLVVTQMLCTMFFARAALKVEMYLGRDLKKKLFTHLQTLSFSYYNTTPVGVIMARVMSDTNKIGSVFAWSLVDVFWSATYVIGCMIVMLFLNWKLALLIIVVVPAIALLTLYFQKRILHINRQARKINAEITRHYNEGISGAKTSKTLVIEDKNTEAFQQVTGRMKDTTVRAVMLNAVYVPIIGFLTALAVAFVITGGGNMVLWGDIGIGELTIFMNFALVIADPVQTLARTISNFISTQANIERVSALLELEPQIQDTPEVIARYGTSLEPKKDNWEPLEGHITFDDITFRYPDGTENVLEHFSLDVPAGTTVAIVGETGAGKSTLVNLACRFFEPTDGRSLIDGRDYRERSQLWLHSNIGYVLQTPHLFSGSVKENIRYGRLDATDEEIVEAAKLVNAHDFILHMENGYDSDVGEGGGQLSTGEKQLVSFARAILANPKIFVLDEATSSIDTKTEALIQNAISTLLTGRTSFLIAHRLSTIRKADLILVVRGGKIIEQGTHQELMEQDGYYADLYHKQFESETAERVFAPQEKA
ncbi:ABC transporter ATP-binding protein [Neglectibacter timonensis]|uniref:ABC transporter ATP-binding protein n=1 Tax=Neglectibacter timonensis TaxID=1776382 RepID=UPI00248EB718|nr:ABC transporter ATP-binding protein [Neglectibacter timonensis]